MKIMYTRIYRIMNYLQTTGQGGEYIYMGGSRKEKEREQREPTSCKQWEGRQLKRIVSFQLNFLIYRIFCSQQSHL